MLELENKDIMLDYLLPPNFEDDMYWDWLSTELDWEKVKRYLAVHALESRYFHFNVSSY